MSKIIQISVSPDRKDDIEFHHQLILQQLDDLDGKVHSIKILKRSIDARKRQVKYILSYNVFFNLSEIDSPYAPNYLDVKNAKNTVHIIGCGPAGLFAALTCLKRGVKPILFERGKDVRLRRRDIASLNKLGVVNPESNYCFGEGGAGTYSDGKLYTRSKKRGNVLEVLQLLVHHGAPEDILVDAHPHIGTNKLPLIIQNITQTIIDHGGEVHFNSKFTDLTIQENAIRSVMINDNKSIKVKALVIATGHSARDVFHLLNKKEIKMIFKPFALGVRVEHKQSLIDQIQYKQQVRSEFLPPSSYSLVYNNGERSVYSFCMCPGGIIAPCATQNNEVVTNGWSPSKRNNPFANSGVVVEVKWEDLTKYHSYGPLAGMMFQQEIEQKSFDLGGGNQKVPAQRMVDFLNDKISSSLEQTSYQPGLKSINLNNLFPDFISRTLHEGFQYFNRKMSGFITNKAILHATESRTSSPVRIPRNEQLEHPDVCGLYPCGEGAGYAGGIVSAAIDGVKCIYAYSESNKID